MYRLFLAFRYLRSRFVNIIAVLGVMVGVAVLIVVTSVFDGFQEKTRESVRGSLSHIILTPIRPADSGPDWTPPTFDDVEKRLLAHDDRIAAVAPLIRLPIVYPYRSNRLEWARMKDQALHQMEALGIDWEKEAGVSALRSQLIAGNAEDPFHDPFAVDRGKTTVIVGRNFAANFKGWGIKRVGPVVVGPLDDDGERIFDKDGNLINEIRVLIPIFKETEAGEIGMDQSSVNPLVKGVYQGLDTSAEMGQMYFDIDQLRTIAGVEYEYFELRVRLHDYKHANKVKESLLASFPNYQTNTWEDMKANFLKVVNTEKVMLMVVLSFIVLLGGFIILATLTLTVVEKTRDIGIMGALGATRGGILSVFVWNGLLIGIIGSLLGLALGWWFVQNVDTVRTVVAKTTGVDLFPPQFYYFREIPTLWRWPTVGAIVGGSMLIAFFAGLLPAMRAARLDPVKALRHE